MIKRRYLIITFSFALILFNSCANNHNKLLKSQDHDAKYEAAVKAFEKEDYFHASQLFENLLMYYRGRQKAEIVAFYYAKSLMGMKDYYSAGYQFESFYKRFPFSANAEEALFLAADCKYKESPDYTLDQTLTKEAMKDFQSYVDKYPESERVVLANKLMDELREKLIKKDYESAYLYYKTGKFQSAQVMLRLFLNNYPDSKYRQDAMYYIIDAGYELASNSVEKKQKERFETVVSDCKKYETLFVEQSNVRKNRLTYIYEQSKKKLGNIEK
ncbi:MAG: outer membrane protein assembly factor BamD [Bacteroidales bacterium]|jgi:outer membrane protein assembly factor BamD|nr:outer membrane protein assembly factor BamD [Bacteroidales bacterium]